MASSRTVFETTKPLECGQPYLGFRVSNATRTAKLEQHDNADDNDDDEVPYIPCGTKRMKTTSQPNKKLADDSRLTLAKA